MNKFDLNSAKFISIVIAMCFIFIMVVWHAFDYLPSEVPNSTLPDLNSQQTTDLQANENKKENEEGEKEEKLENVVERVEELVAVKKEPKQVEIEPFEKIYNETPETNLEETNNFDSDLNKARNMVNQKLYSEAISEYQNIISNSNNKLLQAQCYEEVAIMYASLQRYGSALSAAQRAYNTSPSISREVLLARLYYKTGNIDKATTRINNVLRRDFSFNLK